MSTGVARRIPRRVRVQLQLDVRGHFDECRPPVVQTVQRLEADGIDGNQVAEVEFHDERLVAARVQQFGHLRLRQAACEPNETMIAPIDDLYPAFHDASDSQDSGHGPVPTTLHDRGAPHKAP